MANRLPTVGGDTGNWGTLLNAFLSTEHNSADGTHGEITVSSMNTIVPAHVHVIYCEGDSLTQLGQYPTRLGTLLGAKWRVVNWGISSNVIAQVGFRLTSNLSAGDAEYVCFLIGINDVLSDFSAATIETGLQALYTAAHNAGAKVVAITLLPFKSYVAWSAPRQTVLDTVNAWILATATNVDYRVDAHAMLVDPNVADTLLPANDSGDHLHLSTTGYTLLGTTIFNGVTWTPSATNATLEISGTSRLNQSVRDIDSPTFHGLIVNPIGDQGPLNPTLLVDAVNHRVAFGISTPATAVHIYGPTPVLRIESLVTHAPYLEFKNEQIARIGIDSVGGGTIFTGGGAVANAAQFGTTDAYKVQLFTNNICRLDIATDGKIGVGIMNPAVAFHVNGASGVQLRVSQAADQLGDVEILAFTEGGLIQVRGPTGASLISLDARAGYNTLFGMPGNVGIRVVSPTAALHLPAATAAANTASLKINAGVVATTPVSGNIESDGTHLYWTDSSNARHQLDN